MAYKSLAEGFMIEDPRSDRRGAVCIDHYYVGEQAVYLAKFPHDSYIPFAAIARVWSQASQLSVACCCGKGLPVTVACIKYRSGNKELLQKYIFEKAAKAEEMVALIKSRCGNLEG